MELLEFLQKYGIETAPEGHHHRSRGWVSIDCPYCTPESRRFRLGINERFFTTNCYSCGRQKPSHVLREITRAPWKEILSVIKDNVGNAPADYVPQVKGKLELPEGTGEMLKQHTNYLKKRKFQNIGKLTKLWELKGIGISPTHPWRILIPIHHRGEIVSWTTRAIDDTVEPRYLAAKPSQEKIHSRDLLYGLDYCRHTIALVEGPLDVIAGGPGCACALGTSISPKQLSLISTFPRRVICLDAERSGQKVAQSLVDQLSCFEGETINVVLQTGKDLSRADKSEVSQFRKAFLA